MTQDPVQAVSQIAGLPEGTQEDKELALAFQRGEKGAYQAIYDRYEARVQRICRRLLPNTEDAQDATQETFLRTYRALVRFNGRYQLGPWIARIATNICLDHLRTRRRGPIRAGSAEEHEAELRALDVDPQDILMRDVEKWRVRRVLKSLPPLHRAAIVLRDFEGLTYEEVAVALGITESQVKALLHRARKGFKRTWWSAGVSLLVPARLLHRFRDHGVKEQVSRAAATTPAGDLIGSTAHMAASCGALLQQCGQIVTERMGGVVTAALVGTAIAATAAAPTTVVVPQTRDVHLVTESGDGGGREGSVRSRPSASDGQPASSGDFAPTGLADQPPLAEPDPTPAPSPTPGPEAQPGQGGEGSQPQSPSPFRPALGFDRGQPLVGGVPVAHSATVDCTTVGVEQRLQTSVSDGGAAYPGILTLTTVEVVGIDLVLQKDGSDVHYDGGASSLTTSVTGEQMELSFSGSYSSDGGDDPGSVNLPAYGTFWAELTLDCARSTVIAETVTLSAD